MTVGISGDLYENERRCHPGAALLGRKKMIFGYLDAGSGSLILQAILGGAAGIAVAFRAWKARMMGKETAAEAESDTDKPVPSES